MNNVNITTTRGATRSINIAAPVLENTKNYLLRINDDNELAVLIKTNNVNLDNGFTCNTSGAGVLALTVKELDQLPNDSTYKIYELSTDGNVSTVVAGNLTISGDKSLDPVGQDTYQYYQNGNNIREITEDDVIKITDDYLIYDTAEDITLSLPTGKYPGKIISIKNNSAANIVTIPAVATVDPSQTVMIIHDGTNWIHW